MSAPLDIVASLDTVDLAKISQWRRLNTMLNRKTSTTVVAFSQCLCQKHAVQVCYNWHTLNTVCAIKKREEMILNDPHLSVPWFFMIDQYPFGQEMCKRHLFQRNLKKLGEREGINQEVDLLIAVKEVKLFVLLNLPFSCVL